MKSVEVQAVQHSVAAARPQREAEERAERVLSRIAQDAADQPRDYLAETEVPEGGE